MNSINSIVLVKGAEDLTVEWLTTCININNVESFTTERIGTGQLSECFRVHLNYSSDIAGPPKSVILKVTSKDETSRQSGISLGIYLREVQFYTSIAPPLNSKALAKCYHASFDGTSFCLLLGDAFPAKPGNDLEGATLDQAKVAVAELAKMHAASFGNGEWEQLFRRDKPVITQAQLSYLFAAFVARYGDKIDPEHRKVCERLVASFDAHSEEWNGPRGTHGLVHGDYRLDNMLFDVKDGNQDLTVVDWQTVTWGSTFSDLAYFIGGSLTVEERRAHSDELAQIYHSNLGPNPRFTLEQCQDGVRQEAFFGITMAIVSAILAKQTPRGDEMFINLLTRHCVHALDLNSLATLPAPKSSAPLQPAATDEGSHKPGPEALWNESWYFDFADLKTGIGAYVRLGTNPNQEGGKSWYTAMICGPGRPTVSVLDFEAPLPDPELVIKTSILTATQNVEKPLELYRVTLHGKGEAHADASAILRGEHDRSVDVDLDLRWNTVGTPYQYRIATRYEIPCSVNGTITVEGETFAIEAAPGQRDHSWGVRDWWGMDWVWQAVHLEDGTHIHGLDLRLPQMQKMHMGYIQNQTQSSKTDIEGIGELWMADASEVVGEDGLVREVGLAYGFEGRDGKKELKMNSTAVGHGPLRLVGSDGRVALFPRWWAMVETEDGRKGVAWMELNHQA